MINYEHYDIVDLGSAVQVFTGEGYGDQIAELSKAENIVRHMKDGAYIDTDEAELSDEDVMAIIAHWGMPMAIDVTVDREDKPPLRFKGVHLITESSNPDREMGVRLHCWRHVDGRLVAAIERWSKRKRQRSIWAADVFNEDGHVVEWFAYTPAAKRVYAKLGIDIAEEL